MLVINKLLTKDEISIIRERLLKAPWEDGKNTAHGAAKLVKENQQLIKQVAPLPEISKIILSAIKRSGAVQRYVMPVATISPFINRHTKGGYYGKHVDRPKRLVGSKYVRCDISATLFLSDKDSYDGGELVIYDGGARKVKLNAGDMIIYPAHFLHEVAEVTRGERLAACMWFQSAIRDRDQRTIITELQEIINASGDSSPELQTKLSKVHSNLTRMWME